MRFRKVATFRDKLLALAKTAFLREEWCYSPACLSGTDLAEAPYHGGVHRFYHRVAVGEDPADVAKSEDARWRSYAAVCNAKVAAAPKLTHNFGFGGASSIHYRWVSPDKFTNGLPHLLTMVAISRGER